VTRPHGIAGEIKVQLAPEFVDAVGNANARRVYIDGFEHPHTVLALRAHQGALLLRLDGVRTRNDAESLRGAIVSISLDELPTLSAGEYYAHDLLGLRVQDESGDILGEITDVLATGSNDVYVVRMTSGELLLPAIESVVREIDLEAGVMKAVVPEGLLPAARPHGEAATR
jgi:16S rRNA processing protein RimM